MISPKAVCGPAIAYGALVLTRLRQDKKENRSVGIGKLGIAMRGKIEVVVPLLPWGAKCSALRKIPPVAVCGPAIAYGALVLTRLRQDKKENRSIRIGFFFMVGEAGFGPAKSVTTDLQSAPFGRSGNLPDKSVARIGAGERSRTINLLITNQLLCH